MDLEVCDFLQYKEGPPEEFVVVEVPRDREWFAKYLPVMKDFWDRVLAMRLKGICAVEIDEIQIEPVSVDECEVEVELF
jgi:hypothetical protein